MTNIYYCYCSLLLLLVVLLSGKNNVSLKKNPLPRSSNAESYNNIKCALYFVPSTKVEQMRKKKVKIGNLEGATDV